MVVPASRAVLIARARVPFAERLAHRRAAARRPARAPAISSATCGPREPVVSGGGPGADRRRAAAASTSSPEVLGCAVDAATPACRGEHAPPAARARRRAASSIRARAALARRDR